MLDAIKLLAQEENDRKDDIREMASNMKSLRQVSSSEPNKTSNAVIRKKRDNLRKGKKTQNAKRAENGLKRTLNMEYFYDLLFTRKNLKLVHIVCHDKQEHAHQKCDQGNVFLHQEIDYED